MASEGRFISDWIAGNCVHPAREKFGQPLVLESWQRDFLEEAFRYTDAGAYVYTSILFGGPRDIAKSTISSALSLYKLSPESRIAQPRIIAAANDREQARIVWGHARTMVEHSPELQEVFEYNQNLIWCPVNGGEFERISAEGKTSLGFGFDFQVRDEIAYWTTPKQTLLAEALDTALIKRTNAQAMNVSTAGLTKYSYLGELYDDRIKRPNVETDGGLTVVRDEDSGFLMWWYSAPDSSKLNTRSGRRKAARAACPASWITDDKIEAQYQNPGISEAKWRRQHLNQWVLGAAAWFRAGQWEALCSDTSIPDGSPICVGVDASKNRDSTAVAWAWAADKDSKIVVDAKVWTCVPGDPHHFFFKDGEIDLRVVKDWILTELAARFVVREIAYDPQYMNETAKDLRELGYDLVEIPAGTKVYDQAAQSFYLAVNEEMVTHRNDPVVNNHINNTAGRQTEDGWKIRKLSNSAKIDATVALYLAHSRAKHDATKRGRRYVYSQRLLNELKGET
jgi:phage terminase large subunit-like protein